MYSKTVKSLSIKGNKELDTQRSFMNLLQMKQSHYTNERIVKPPLTLTALFDVGIEISFSLNFLQLRLKNISNLSISATRKKELK